MLARISKIAAAIVLGAIVAVCLLLLAMWGEHRTGVTLPSPTGPFAVGRTLQAWTNPGTREELAVWIWYPAGKLGQSRTDYLPPAWRQALRDAQGTFMRSFFKRDPAMVHAHSEADPPMASDQRTSPVVLLRPGGSALTTDFTTLAEDLASHGYVVVGFDAPARSFVFVGSEGQVIGRAPGNDVESANGNLEDPVIGRLLAMWLSDAKAVVDHLQSLNATSTAPFGGRLDFERLGAVGHSFGGAQALQFCHDDRRCRSAIDLDGIPFGSVVTGGVTKPAMFLLSDHSRDTSDLQTRNVLSRFETIYDGLPEPRVCATIRNANHFSFSDQILLSSHIAMALLRFAGLGGLDGRRGLAIVDDYVRTYFDVTLQGAPSDVLNRLAGRYPEVVGECTSSIAGVKR